MHALNPARFRLLETFALDAAMTRGSGFSLFDDTGREYLDFLAQYGALPFGHNPPHVWDAIDVVRREQIPSMVQPLRPVEAERLAQRLAEVTPGDLAITTLANSGAETVEAAIKLARIRTGRDMILSTWNGFHGKTLGALSATGKPLYQQGFNAPAPAFDYIAYGDLDALERRLEAEADRIAAFIFEPIQGEGGVVCPPEGYVDAAIALCRKHGVLTILDEIQTGLGRTGELFACSGGTEVPDMLLLSKALGGGLMPIGACIVRPSAWDERFGRLHSSTFANNNLAAAVACATLDRLLEDDQALIRSVAANGAYLRGRLEAMQRAYPDVVREVRGRGYMLGLEFHSFAEQTDSATMAFASLNGGVTALVSSYLLNVHGLLTAPLFNETHVLRLQPALIVGRAEIDRAVEALTAACDAIHRRDYAAIVRHLAARALPEPAEEVQPQADAPAATAATAVPGRFAFLIHYTEEEDLFRSDPSFRQFDEHELSNWQDWVKRLGPGHARRIPNVTSKTGAVAEGWILSVPMLPNDMRGKGRQGATRMIRDAADMAVADGASRLGLGAFTSIVTRGGEAVTGRGVPITSGNTLTTVSAVKSLETLARRSGIALEQAHVAVVGASGAIGRLAAMMLARRAGRMTLVGNAGNPFAPRLLAKVADEICTSLAGGSERAGIWPGALSLKVQDFMRGSGTEAVRSEKGAHALFARASEARGTPPALAWTTDLKAALDQADIVLVATSSEMALVDPRDLRPGTLVCDVARPPNVAEADLAGTGVFVFDGGLVRPPSSVDLGAFQTLPTDLCWGCLGETMLLALAGQEKDFSIGSRLSLDDADLVARLAEEHGFEPAAPQWYGRHASEAEIDRFAERVGQVRAARAVRRAEASREWRMGA